MRLKQREVTCGGCGEKRRVVDGSELRALRHAAGLSLRELAAKLKLTPSYLCDVELNRRNATDVIVDGYKRVAR